MAYRYINPYPAWYGLRVYKSSQIQPGMAYGYINPAWYGLQVYKSSLVWLAGI